uniref:Uncharacterized protein n=1 Tax=Anguilla anguilla TaxID=7936 RepID=A0A0E9VIU2_ANGAN
MSVPNIMELTVSAAFRMTIQPLNFGQRYSTAHTSSQ